METTMSDTATLLDGLVDDAKRVAAYGQRTGRLKDHGLLTAIAAIEKLPARNWASPEVVTLQMEMNRSLQAIAPTDLSHLRSSWDPFGAPRSRFGQFAFVLATLILMAVTALATFEYNRGTTLLTGVETLQKDDPRAAIGAIVRQLLAVNIPATTAVTTAGTNISEQQSLEVQALLDEPHFTLIDKLHEIDGRLGFYLPLMSQFRANHQLPHEIAGHAVRDAQAAVIGFFTPQAANAASGVETKVPVVDQSQLKESGLSACASRKTIESPYTTDFRNTNVAKSLTRYLRNVLDLVCVEGLTYPPTSIPSYAKFIEDMTEWSRIWGLWYLPALYGALGAALYYMRRILDPTIPDPSAIDIAHRTALGAFAGIIITWFWAPNSQLTEGFTSVGITVFTLAFLIGFSVEVLFAMLDRLVNTLVDFAKGAGTAPPPPAVSAS